MPRDISQDQSVARLGLNLPKNKNGPEAFAPARPISDSGMCLLNYKNSNERQKHQRFHERQR
jgi:hypothetical protein